MIERRAFIIGFSAASALGLTQAGAAEEPGDIYELEYPTFESIDSARLFGYKPATQAEIDKARLIVANTPTGPAPIDIAQSFVDRFEMNDPDAISQWPVPASWNPLVVDFFQATSTKANNDMTPWCAAFANWCIERAGKHGSRDASSQSFLGKNFVRTMAPKRGDLAVFTCFDPQTGKSLGLGHVTFFKGPVDDRYINVVGDNQSKDGHASIICEEKFPIFERNIHRHVNGKYVACKMRLNTYIALS